MNFRTLVELPFHEMEINHAGKILLLGSCFAENIGQLLEQNKFTCDINPFGVLYNPLSILKALKEVQECKKYHPDELLYYQGRWHSLMHHSSFSDFSQELCLNNINCRLQKAAQGLSQAHVLLVTFGTAYVYVQKDSDSVVGNCHKLPEAMFNRRLLAVDEIVSGYSDYISMMREINPGLKYLFTVSPTRHVKDGMNGNQVSKSVLLLAVHRLKELYPETVFYFPSYEIMMDELRDYRFYADDMLHPSLFAVRYIWECFVKSYFSEKTQLFMQEWEQIVKALNHKAFEPSSEKYKSFLMQNVLKIKRVKEKYPYLDVEKELELCRILLGQ